ncbi:SDR family NAD(P)-dependent oxidoreductase [Kitasatospora sp. NPDC015120]|uniref:SDR family NAD(P)-dependent oxidoreductase n=1 Tax=Kitasatospora sp. NPDC015120 TaxID=3364023 RepID=UPI0036F4AD9F
MKDYKDKVVVITGGATGIGFAYARAFGRDGARIVLAGRRENRLREAVDTLTTDGVEAAFQVCDVTDREQVVRLADFAQERFGRVDVIVNNAGTGMLSPVLETSLADVRKLFEANFFGVWHVAEVFARRFVEQGTPAAIYNVGSENSLFHAAFGGAGYVASKQSVGALSESLREELPDFIEVSLICPGFVRSEIEDPEFMAHGMDTDRFVDITMPQLRAGRFYVVSHSYNAVRIAARYKEIMQAYETYAPRYDGDEEFDVRTVAAQAAADQQR